MRGVVDAAFQPSPESTKAWSGGSRYSPTTSTSFSENCVALEIVKDFTRWG